VHRLSMACHSAEFTDFHERRSVERDNRIGPHSMSSYKVQESIMKVCPPLYLYVNLHTRTDPDWIGLQSPPSTASVIDRRAESRLSTGIKT
jgi:hypothetical protein